MNPELETKPKTSAVEQEKADDFVGRLAGGTLLSNPPGTDFISLRISLEKAESEVRDKGLDERLLKLAQDSYTRSINLFANWFGLSALATRLAVEQQFRKLSEENETDDTKF